MDEVINLEITLVRHGETAANHLKLIQGWTDNPLNETGKQQAHDAGKFLKKVDYLPDLAYTSPLIRASVTGEIILNYLDVDIPIIPDFHFIERNFGPFEHHKAIPTLKKVLTKGFYEPGYESDEMIQKRVYNGLKNLYRFHQEKKIIIFCHSHVIKSCLIIAEKNTYNYKDFIANGSLHKFKFDGNNLKLLDFSFNI